VLVEAVRLVGDPRFKILLAGRTEPPPSPEMRWLGALQDIGRAHAAADLFVLPTRYEAASLAIVEALGSSLPVITTNVPGARDHIVPGITGAIQRDPHDAAELAALLRPTLDPRLRAAWAEAAAPSVAHLRWPMILDRVDGLLSTGQVGLASAAPRVVEVPA
jgi:glycosyltransferase involved in cell wall biosynthesis